MFGRRGFLGGLGSFLTFGAFEQRVMKEVGVAIPTQLEATPARKELTPEEEFVDIMVKSCVLQSRRVTKAGCKPEMLDIRHFRYSGDTNDTVNISLWNCRHDSWQILMLCATDDEVALLSEVAVKLAEEMSLSAAFVAKTNSFGTHTEFAWRDGVDLTDAYQKQNLNVYEFLQLGCKSR